MEQLKNYQITLTILLPEAMITGGNRPEITITGFQTIWPRRSHYPPF